MSTARRAVIDVGTNSVKLLVAEVTGRAARPLLEESRQTRLGHGFYETRRLQPGPLARTAEAVREFTALARAHGAEEIRVIATSATREAVNAAELTQAIANACGLSPEIISGDQEAKWAFQGVTTGAVLVESPMLLLDVGGGSTEFILGCGQTMTFARSFPLGTVRLLEKFPPSDPPTDAEFNACRDAIKQLLRGEVRPLLAPVLQNETDGVRLVGTGGTTSILAGIEHKLDHFDREKIEQTCLTFEKVVAFRKMLWELPLTSRRQIRGLPPSRADVILTGVLIYEAVMEEFGFAALCVSTRGLRFGAVMSKNK